MLPKTGSFFLSHEQYAEGIARALRTELGATHQAVKTLMKWTNANERTAKNWLAGVSGPRGEHLAALIQHSDLALDTFLHMAQRRQAVVAATLPTLRDKLLMAVATIDACLSDTVANDLASQA